MMMEVKWCGSSYAVQVATPATVGELKLRIREATGLPTKRQNLFLPGVNSALKDDVLLLPSRSHISEVHLVSLKQKNVESYRALYWKHEKLVSGIVQIKDYRMRTRDFDDSMMNLSTGGFTFDILEVECCIKKATKEQPVMISSFKIMKNFRHQNAVTVECFYKEGNQFRLVLSPRVDGTLEGWARVHGINTLFCITNGSTTFSDLYRQIIIDLCEVVVSLLKEGICPRKVSECNLYLKVLEGQPRLRALIDDVEYLKDNVALRKKQVADIWTQISSMVFASVKKCQVPSLQINSEGFCKYIGKQSTALTEKHAIKKLEAYPDKWNCQAKGAYLIQLVAADKSAVWHWINDSGLKWPKNDIGELPGELNALIQEAAVIGKYYKDDDPYDYVRLFRNVFKKFDTLSPKLQADFGNQDGLIQRFEEWTPRDMVPSIRGCWSTVLAGRLGLLDSIGRRNAKTGEECFLWKHA